MVWQGSSAAFTADTKSVGNNWATGSLTLTDDDNGSAMFTVANIVPGQSGSNCIKVTASPTVPSTVKVYAHNLQADGLEDYVVIDVQKGTGGGFGTCDGFVEDSGDAQLPAMSLADAYAAMNSYATGILPWVVPAGTSSRVYKINWVFDVSALSEAEVDLLQGQSVSFDGEWEMQNN